MNCKYNKSLKYILLLLLVAITLRVSASEATDTVASEPPLRPVTQNFMFDIGKTSLLDTYLTPIRYKGMNLGLSYERNQAMKFSPEKWIMQMQFGVSYSKANNPAKNGSLYYGNAFFNWGMMHRWNIAPNFRLMVGGATGMNAGVVYNSRNSNNPASAKASVNVSATGMATYNLKIGKMRTTLRYQPLLPLVGIMFSPEFGETYYEIYLGNRKNLAQCSWVGNSFSMVNFLSLDMRIRSTILRIGYRNTISTSYVNKLNTQIFTNSFVIGVGGDFMNLTPGSSVERARRKVIPAFY